MSEASGGLSADSSWFSGGPFSGANSDTAGGAAGLQSWSDPGQNGESGGPHK